METKAQQIDLGFATINVLRFAQFDLGNKFDKEAHPLLDFTTDVQFRVLEKMERIACVLSLMIKIKETGEEFAELKVETQFNVKPFHEVIIRDKSKETDFNIPDVLIYNVANISVSTMRGILHEKMKGTIAQNDVFPLLDLAPYFLKNKEGKHA